MYTFEWYIKYIDNCILDYSAAGYIKPKDKTKVAMLRALRLQLVEKEAGLPSDFILKDMTREQLFKVVDFVTSFV